jgi:hypothetical protein
MMSKAEQCTLQRNNENGVPHLTSMDNSRRSLFQLAVALYTLLCTIPWIGSGRVERIIILISTLHFVVFLPSRIPRTP